MANPTANAGTASVFVITASGGSNLGSDITQYTTSIRPNYEGARIDVTTLGNTSRRKISGFKDNSIDVEGVWDTTIDGILMAILAGSAAPIRYGPAGTASGNAQHNGTAVLTAYSAPTDRESAVTWTGRWEVNGDMTRTTY